MLVRYKFVLQEGVYIYGLYLDGAGWDKRFQQLCESANKVLYATMPVIHVYAINSVEPKDSRLYQVISILFYHRDLYLSHKYYIKFSNFNL